MNATTTKTTTPPKQELDADTAKRVLDVDLSNLLQKVKSGKPLSKNERDLIEAHTGQQPNAPGTSSTWPQWANSMAEAARITAITRQTLHQWRKAGCPAFKANNRINLHELAQWIDATGRKPAPDAPTGRTESQRARLLRAQADAREFENEIQQGKYMLASDYNRALAAIARTFWPPIRKQVEQAVPEEVERQLREIGIVGEPAQKVVAALRALGVKFIDDCETDFRRQAEEA